MGLSNGEHCFQMYGFHDLVKGDGEPLRAGMVCALLGADGDFHFIQ